MKTRNALIGTLAALVALAVAFAAQLAPAGTLGPSLGFACAYAAMGAFIPWLAVLLDEPVRARTRRTRVLLR